MREHYNDARRNAEHIIRSANDAISRGKFKSPKHLHEIHKARADAVNEIKNLDDIERRMDDMDWEDDYDVEDARRRRYGGRGRGGRSRGRVRVGGYTRRLPRMDYDDRINMDNRYDDRYDDDIYPHTPVMPRYDDDRQLDRMARTVSDAVADTMRRTTTADDNRIGPGR